MKIQDIGPAIVKRGWIVIALVLVSTLVAAVIAQVQSPVYKVEIAVSATAPINRTTGLPDALTQSAYIALMPSIANFAESIGVAEQASARLALQGIEITPEELLKKVSAVPEANSTSAKITFTDGSPTRVEEIANTWGDVLAAKTNQNSDIYDPDFKNLLLNGNIVVTNRATAPEKPTQPKTFAYIGLGFFTGLILGLVLVIFIEYFNPHFRNPREVEETLELPMLGILPREKGSRSTSVLPSFSEGSRAWEAYSELRSGLIMPPEAAPATILVASAIPFEAGASVAGNIAASIANTGRRVLLIDCDLRGRALSGLMGAEGRPGLSDALAGGGDLRGDIVETGVSNLYFLPAGSKRENSTDLLSMPSFAEEIGEQEGLYDKVLLYGPPLAGSVDAVVVAAQAEASVVVIDADRCTRKAAQEALFNFDRLGITPTGVILANVKVKGGDRKRPAREEAKAASSPVPVETPSSARKSTAEKKERRGRKAEEAPTAGGGTEPPEAVKAPSRRTAAPDASPHAVEAGAPAPVAKAPGREGAAAGAVKEQRQIRENVAEDFRRMGEAGSPIPKNWLRALNSDQADVRDSAAEAITIYYHTFLRRYRISEDSVESIAASIIRMMRREGEFAAMGEEEAQAHLRQMLVDAGARFSPPPSPAEGTPGEEAAAGRKAPPADGEGKDLKRQEKRRFRLDVRGGRKAGGSAGPSRGNGSEEGVDWE